MADDIWVFSEKLALAAELIAGAKTLDAGAVTAVVAGPRSDAESALARGAQRVLWLGEMKPGWMVEDYVPTLAQLVQNEKPFAVLIGATRRGKSVAGRLAACLGLTVLTDVLEMNREGSGVRITHLLFGGGAVRTEKMSQMPLLLTVGGGVFSPAPAQTGAAGEIVEVPMVEPERRFTVRERKTLPKASVNLSVARRVVSAGRGIGKKEDLSMVEQLAQLLGAEVACTRPLAEGLDWLPRERYIGISGATVKPDLYFGVGVSGQVQHMIGMNGSRIVVAVNKDTNAPIFSHCDYGVPADLYVIIPALIQALQNRK